MQITTGTRLGPYEIVSPLGAGGMGEVWRARDTRLDRSVAVKILPSSLAYNAQLRLRFEREARAISQLNHPHICTVHDVGKEDGVDYLVMELLEGESLAERLTRGPLPLHEVVRYGVQIAEALDRAHRGGIVHRDLKPGNVMITKSGAKLLDFGLARAAGNAAAHPDTPTEHLPLTAEGTIVGTFQYMAPEQLAGEDADHRTDIFALGAVLYEMLTGTRAFQGKNRTSLIAAIVGGEPPRVSTIQPLTPPALEHLIARCLAKDPEDRWQSAHDIAEELKWIGEAGSQAGVAAPVTARRRNRERILGASAAILMLVAGALGWALWKERAKPVRSQRSFFVPPADGTLQFAEFAAASVTLSPNGRYLTYTVDITGGPLELWLFDRETGDTRRIAQGNSPFWSPDSRSIAFWGDGKLRRLDIAGGPAVAIADGGNGRGGSWNADGTIVYEPDWREPLHRVSASGGGKSSPVTKLDAGQGETTHRWPWFLPDGRHFLYLAGSHKTAADSDVNAIYIGSLDSPDRKLLLRARSNAIYANGHVLFVRENYLLAQPFDPKKLELTGDPVRVAQNVTNVPGFFRAVFSAAEDGTLAFATGPSEPKRSLKWYSADGKEISTIPVDVRLERSIRLSPDGKQAAVTVGDPTDIWIVDLERGTPSRFTTAVMQENSPVWSPDGSRIAYGADTAGFARIVEKPADGLTGERVVFEKPQTHLSPNDWSADGRFLLADSSNPKLPAGGDDVWLVPMNASGPPRPLIQTEFDDWNAQFSPDGRWVTWLSDESGRDELYASPFPGRGKRQLTGIGVAGYVWLRNGREIRLATTQGGHFRIKVEGSSFGIAEDAGKLPPGLVNLDFNADGSRILAIMDDPSFKPSPITLVTNWTKALAGADRE